MSSNYCAWVRSGARHRSVLPAIFSCAKCTQIRFNDGFVILGTAFFLRNGTFFVIHTKTVESSEAGVTPLKARALTKIVVQKDLKSTWSMLSDEGDVSKKKKEDLRPYLMAGVTKFGSNPPGFPSHH